MLRAAATARPEAIAFVEGSRRVTYAEFAASVEQIAGNLFERGVGKGDRVALLVGNRIEFAQMVFAAARIGAIIVPINVRQRKQENHYVLQNCGAKALIHEADLAEEIPDRADLPELRHRFSVGGTSGFSAPYADLCKPTTPAPEVAVDEDETFSILYTSGTTGRPKGALLTHLGVVHSCLHISRGLELEPADVCVLCVPASHVTGLVAIILTMVLAQGRLIIMPAFKARAFLEIAERESVTFGVLVPAMYNLCLLDPDFERFDLSSWRIGAYGGAPMPEATIRRVAEKQPRIMLLNSYGATETTSPTSLMPLGKGIERIDSVGRVLPCGEVRVMDDNGREVPAGEPGEIWIAGPMVSPGYWNNPEANQANFVGGYWKSGDIGSKDASGYLKVFDRKKDMINRGGFKVYSAEVENVLNHLPGVIECAIVGTPDAVLGEKTRAFVVRGSETLTEDQIRTFCRTQMADYKVPDTIIFLSEPLPRNANGKIIKRELAAR
jgi:acyl-CoA synthetase (AMP-forming)/AMP-acid ligase II